MKKLWSGRFKKPQAGNLESFSESVSFDKRLWKYDIKGSMAHARMLSKSGIISKKDEREILSGLGIIAKSIEDGTFEFKTGLEDVHMNIEAALIGIAGPSGAKLHTARSRNDQIALDLMLYLKDETDAILKLITSLQKTLLGIAKKHMDIIMPGYTHMQKAQPVLLAHHLLAYVEMLQRDKGRLTDCKTRMDALPLGACALAGTSLPVDRESVAKDLGFKGVAQNSMDAVSDRDFALEFLSFSAILMMHLSRLSEEIIIWSTDEFSFITLPDEYSTGSSIMPQKKNPDPAELIRGKTGRVYGNLMCLLTIMKGLPMAYNRDMQEDKPPVFDSVDTIKACLGVLCSMMPLLKFNKDRMKDAAGDAFSTATDMAEYLVLQGMPFRNAHETTGKVVAHCIDKGIGLTDMRIEDLRKFSKLFKEDVFQRLAPLNSVKLKKSKGGTAPELVRARINSLSKSILK